MTKTNRIKQKLYLNLILLFTIINVGYSQSFTKEEVIKFLPLIYKTKVDSADGKKYIYETIDSLPACNVFCDLSNDNSLYLDYIQQNYSNINYDQLEKFKFNTYKRNECFIQQLGSDSIFRKYFLELSCFYLNSKNIIITDYFASQKFKLTTDELTSVASKFFFADTIVNDTTISWKICVGYNGFMNDKKNNMFPLVEGFCFMTVMNNMEDTVFDYMSDFDSSVITIEKRMSLKHPSEMTLDNIRKTMYHEMSGSKNLKSILLREFNKKKKMLNFEIAG